MVADRTHHGSSTAPMRARMVALRPEPGRPSPALLEALGRRQHHRQPGRLLGRQPGGVDAENSAAPRPGRRTALAPLHVVEVDLQDALLVSRASSIQRQHQLLRLAQHGALARQQQVLGQLLGDGRAADAAWLTRRPLGCRGLAARASARWLRSQAFSMASHSTPAWSAKPASSLAITARLRWRRCGRSRPRSGSRPLLPVDRQAPGSLRWKVVDCRVDQAISAMRSSKHELQRQRAAGQQRQQRSSARPRARPDSCAPPGGAQRLQHRRRVGAHAAPDEEGLGRLLDQHAQAVAAAAPCARAQARKGWRPAPYIRSTASAPGPAPPPAPAPAAACRLLALALMTTSKPTRRAAIGASRPHATQRRHQRHGAPTSGLRALGRAVGQHQLPAAPQQRPQHAGRRAAGAHQQHAAAGQRPRRHWLDVAHQADAVGVVGQPAARRRSAGCWRRRPAARARCTRAASAAPRT
jgi:hypothetical protein